MALMPWKRKKSVNQTTALDLTDEIVNKWPIDQLRTKTKELIKHQRQQLLYQQALLAAGYDRVYLATGADGIELPCLVNDDHTLTWFGFTRSKTIDIKAPGITTTKDLREIIMGKRTRWTKFKFWLANKLHLVEASFGIITYRLFFAQLEGEYTINPYDDSTPEEIQRLNEIQIEIGQAAVEAKIGKSIMEDLNDDKPWWESLATPLFMFGLVFMFLMFMWQTG